jgi:catechol 2,3-dioxygenase-like lactoylglutathione lyase family enzyme
MFDHVVVNVSDLEASKRFYSAALAPLGMIVGGEHAGLVAIGTPENAFFWIARRDPVVAGSHVAFTASDRATVDAFYAAALAAGGTDNGAPGVREIYHPNYYGAFVLDPDGINLEAVCHTAP